MANTLFRAENPINETRENRLKRMTMRSMRRGIKEMDIILQRFSADNLSQMDSATLDLYDDLLHEYDQDLYQWVTGQTSAPEVYKDLISRIATAISGEK